MTLTAAAAAANFFSVRRNWMSKEVAVEEQDKKNTHRTLDIWWETRGKPTICNFVSAQCCYLAAYVFPLFQIVHCWTGWRGERYTEEYRKREEFHFVYFIDLLSESWHLLTQTHTIRTPNETLSLSKKNKLNCVVLLYSYKLERNGISIAWSTSSRTKQNQPADE